MNSDKLIGLLESHENGNISHFWGKVKKLSRKDRVKLVELARIWHSGGNEFAFVIAESCILLDFN